MEQMEQKFKAQHRLEISISLRFSTDDICVKVKNILHERDYGIHLIKTIAKKLEKSSGSEYDRFLVEITGVCGDEFTVGKPIMVPTITKWFADLEGEDSELTYRIVDLLSDDRISHHDICAEVKFL